MIRPDLSKWEYKEELKGLLVFAQALDEMLFHHTIDTYKATALGVRTNILELRYLANQMKSSTKMVKVLEPIIDELGSRLKSDILIKPKFSTVFSHYLQKIESLKSNPSELVVLLNALLSEIETSYWNNLLTTIEEKVADPKLKNDIVFLANTFIVEAEQRKFSRSYIYFQAKNFFFARGGFPQKINSPTQIKDFLSLFNVEPSNWKVVFKGNEPYKDIAEYAQYFSHPEFTLTINDETLSGVPDELKRRERYLTEKRADYPVIISVDISKEVRVMEPISARDVAKASLDTLFDVYSFIAHIEQPHVLENSLVINKDTKEVHSLQPSPNPMMCGIQRKVGENAKSEIEIFIDIVNSKHFEPASSYLIVKALDFHRAALEAQTPENQLLDLWAALEGFLPSPSDTEARIVHFKDALIPSLTLTYPEKVINYMADNVFHGGGKCRDIVMSVDVGDNFFEKFTALLVCDDLTDKRKELYSELDAHPLLCYRIYQTHLAFKSKKAIKNTLLTHREKVSWHIQRIYTTRNQIIHNARSLPYLRTLVENLHSYLDILIEATSVVALTSPARISIPSALNVLEIHEKGFLQSLDLEGEDILCTKDNYSKFVFGLDNPINPFNGVSFFESSYE